MASYTPGVPSPQQPLPQRPDAMRARGSSDVSASRYRPDNYPANASTPNYQTTTPQGNYFAQAPQPPPGANYFPTPPANPPPQGQMPYYQGNQPYGSPYLSAGPNTPQQAPPYPTSDPLGQPSGATTQPMPIPGSQWRDPYMSQAPQVNSFPGNNYLSPSDATRLRSESYSGPTVRPEAGRHRRRSSPGAGRHRRASYDEDEGRPHHHRHHHSHHGSLSRTDTHRPTIGDTMVSMFDVMKNYLGPVRRD